MGDPLPTRLPEHPGAAKLRSAPGPPGAVPLQPAAKSAMWFLPPRLEFQQVGSQGRKSINSIPA